MSMLPKLLPALGFCVTLGVHAVAPRPNVLVILTDDQRWDALGVVQREQGDQALFPWFKTPNLDRLAAEGGRFANAFVTTSLCSPSRASFLSGRFARRHQVLNNYANYRAADGKPAWLEESLPTWHGHNGPLYGLKDYDRFVRAYLATLRSVDESVGRIYGALKDSGQLDTTVFVFTSDNGFVLGEHGRVDKRTMYEESIRIPLLVRYPPLVKPGTVIRQIVLSHDLAPSLIELCGAKPLKDITGRSFRPLLQGKSVRWRSSFLYEYNYEAQFPYTPNVRGVRTGQWKLVHYPPGDGSRERFAAELYHLEDDPHELRNLINDPAFAAKREALERELARLSKQAGPDWMPVYQGIVNVLPKY